jgi:hypothetical protein
MRLNETNRRRALERRRKLMPEPRRISMNQEPTRETTALREVPAVRDEMRPAHAPLPRIEQPEQDVVLAQL